MATIARVATEDPLWAVEALVPLLDDYKGVVPVRLDLGGGRRVVGELTAVDQGIALVTVDGGSVRLVPLDRVHHVVVDVPLV
jgi:hypothetical protein